MNMFQLNENGKKKPRTMYILDDLILGTTVKTAGVFNDKSKDGFEYKWAVKPMETRLQWPIPLREMKLCSESLRSVLRTQSETVFALIIERASAYIPSEVDPGSKPIGDAISSSIYLSCTTQDDFRAFMGVYKSLKQQLISTSQVRSNAFNALNANSEGLIIGPYLTVHVHGAEVPVDFNNYHDLKSGLGLLTADLSRVQALIHEETKVLAGLEKLTSVYTNVDIDKKAESNLQSQLDMTHAKMATYTYVQTRLTDITQEVNMTCTADKAGSTQVYLSKYINTLSAF